MILDAVDVGSLANVTKKGVVGFSVGFSVTVLTGSTPSYTITDDEGVASEAQLQADRDEWEEIADKYGNVSTANVYAGINF